MSEELVFQIALELIPGIGNRGVKQLFSYCGSATNVFKTPKSKLLNIPGVGEKLAQAIKEANTFKEAESIVKVSVEIEADILHYTNSQFPSRLKQLTDAPNIIYKKGKGDLNPPKSVAVVGTRKATAYGKSVTDKIIEDLMGLGVTVISGLAYGIDIQAHKASLKNGIPTYAVLAGGLDRVYPSVHKKYAVEMLEKGGLITESAPGTKPDPHLFPARNRIIAGMADATIIVEAAAKGGALITANIADSYNRLVFAVPGGLDRTYSEGTNTLIANQRALIYTNIADFTYHLNWDIEAAQQKEEKVLPELSQEERIIFELLKERAEAIAIDLISIQSQIPINQVASHLLNLEFKNLIKSLPGKKYEIV